MGHFEFNEPEPVVRSNSHPLAARELNGRRCVFAEFKKVLRHITNGDVDLYVGIRSHLAGDLVDGLQVTASGFTFEEAENIKLSYLAARDRIIGRSSIEKLAIALDPLEAMSGWPPEILHHGVLVVAKRGLILRVPEKFLSGANLRVYGEILLAWV